MKLKTTAVLGYTIYTVYDIPFAGFKFYMYI